MVANPLSCAIFERITLFKRSPWRRFSEAAGGSRQCTLKRAFAAGFLAILFSTQSVSATEIDVTGVRLGLHADKTRLVIDLTDKVNFRVLSLRDPDRVVVDLPEVEWKFGAPPPTKKTGLVNSLRYGLFQAGNSRIVLDVSGRVKIQNSFVIPPKPSDKRYRLVIDLVKATGPETAERKIVNSPSPLPIAPRQAASQQAAKITPPPPTRFERPGIKPSPPVERPENRRKVIVIDPGHGGVDPGAIGRSGVFEKKLTLAAAHALKRELDRSGRYQVFLTRNGDSFLRLRDRFAVARRNKADLFISLHADTIRRRDVRGLSVYTLSEKASDREAAELAEQENKADLIAGVDLTDEPEEVTNILIDLAQRETLNQSARFARNLVEELRGVTALLRNSHRFAGFAVLKAPDVPSVLIELGFLSNRQDEKALMQPGYRKKIAVALKRAIDRYFVRVEQVERR